MSKGAWTAVIIIAAIIIIGGIWYFGFYKTKPQPTPTPAANGGNGGSVESLAPATGEPIKIGAILPLTGDGAVYGKNAQQGINLALDEINGAGGINGAPLQVLFEDSQLDPRTAVSAANKLCTVDNVPIIIGPMASATVEAVIPVAHESKVVLISPSATAHELSGKPGFFRTIVSDIYDGTAMAEFAYNELGAREIPVFHIDAAGPAGVTESFKSRFTELGGLITADEVALTGATDLRTQISKIAALNPAYVYFAAYAQETATFLIQAREKGLKATFLTHQVAEDPQVRELAGDAANGLIFTTPKLDKTSDIPSVLDFISKYEARYNEEPGNFSSNSYDAIYWGSLVLAQPDHTYAGIKSALLAIKDYAGASGVMTVDENGDVEQEMRIMEINGSKIVAYRPD